MITLTLESAITCLNKEHRNICNVKLLKSKEDFLIKDKSTGNSFMIARKNLSKIYHMNLEKSNFLDISNFTAFDKAYDKVLLALLLFESEDSYIINAPPRLIAQSHKHKSLDKDLEVM